MYLFICISFIYISQNRMLLKIDNMTSMEDNEMCIFDVCVAIVFHYGDSCNGWLRLIIIKHLGILQHKSIKAKNAKSYNCW